MALTYDFDIYSALPAGVAGGEGKGVALFRDAATVEALRQAPESLRTFFLDSGFGLNQSPVRLPPGTYRESDEAERLDVIGLLTQNLKTHELPRADQMPEGGFSFQAFLQALTTAQPVDDPAPEPAAPRPADPEPAPVPQAALGQAQPSPAPIAPVRPAAGATARPRPSDDYVPMPGSKPEPVQPPPELDPRIPPPPTEPEPPPKLGAVPPPPEISREDIEDRRRKSMAALVILVGVGLIAAAFLMR